MEVALGATASSRAEPDFPHLGVEMKTIPVGPDGRPTQSTYVCVAPADGSLARTWNASWVRRKLSKVLWIPITTGPGIDLPDRRVGTPLLWTPDPEESAALREDWEDLSDAIHRGEFWAIDARRGKVLQLRPKAAKGTDLAWAVDDEGYMAQVQPRGFYLRASFTHQVLSKRFIKPS